MKDDATNLDHLHDLLLPPADPWWPLAPGWMILLGLVLVILLAAMLRWFFRWQADRYRREAIRLLDDPSFPDSALPELVKRVALTAWPRTEVANLTDEPLLSFLNRTGGNVFSSEGPSLEAVAFEQNPAANSTALREEVRRWVMNHRCETHQTT